MLPQHSAGGVFNEAGAHLDVLAQPGAGVTFGDEADVIGVRFLGDGETAASRFFTHLGLRGGGGEGEPGVLELLVGQHPQNVGLVFCPVGGAVQFTVAVVVGDNSGVVPGNDGVEP